jgi:polysaccharide pyruvyl transferase WcaK-like protein
MSKAVHRPPRVGLISPCGGGNLGDAAILDAMIEGVRSRTADAEFFAMTFNPQDTERRHRIPAFRLTAERYVLSEETLAGWCARRSVTQRLYSLRWLRPILRLFLRALYFAASLRNELRHFVSGLGLAKGADLMVVAGGGQLDDYWGGAWSHPYNLFKWGCIARVAGTPVVVLSVGYGTKPSRFSRVFLRTILRMSAYNSFRDPRSASLAHEWLGEPQPIVVPDLAFGLPVKSAQRAPARKTVIGISPIAFAHPRWWPQKDAALYDAYIGRLAQFVDWLGVQGHELVLFCTDTMDVHCVRDLYERCTARTNIVTNDAARPLPYYKDVEELIAQLAPLDMVVASRLHGVILAHRLAKPVLAISYDWKVDVHMQQVGESDNVLDIGTMNAAALIARFTRLAQRRVEIERKLRDTARGFGQQVSGQFDRVADQFLRRPAPSPVTRS